MTSPLDELYLQWLYRQFADPEITDASRTYWNLTRCLYAIEFIWIVPNDDNRIEDGRYLRTEFIDDLELSDVDPDWLKLGCSMLELLVGISRRMSFLAEEEPAFWFWHLISNLELHINDRRYFPSGYAEEVLNRVIFRTFDRNGIGGIFPLENPCCDQREAEMWHQLSSYVTAN